MTNKLKNNKATLRRVYTEENGKYYLTYINSNNPNDVVRKRPITKKTYDLRPQYGSTGQSIKIKDKLRIVYGEENGKYYMSYVNSNNPDEITQKRPITKRTYDLKAQYGSAKTFTIKPKETSPLTTKQEKFTQLKKIEQYTPPVKKYTQPVSAKSGSVSKSGTSSNLTPTTSFTRTIATLEPKQRHTDEELDELERQLKRYGIRKPYSVDSDGQPRLSNYRRDQLSQGRIEAQPYTVRHDGKVKLANRPATAILNGYLEGANINDFLYQLDYMPYSQRRAFIDRNSEFVTDSLPKLMAEGVDYIPNPTWKEDVATIIDKPAEALRSVGTYWKNKLKKKKKPTQRPAGLPPISEETTIEYFNGGLINNKKKPTAWAPDSKKIYNLGMKKESKKFKLYNNGGSSDLDQLAGTPLRGEVTSQKPTNWMRMGHAAAYIFPHPKKTDGKFKPMWEVDGIKNRGRGKAIIGGLDAISDQVLSHNVQARLNEFGITDFRNEHGEKYTGEHWIKGMPSDATWYQDIFTDPTAYTGWGVFKNPGRFQKALTAAQSTKQKLKQLLQFYGPGIEGTNEIVNKSDNSIKMKKRKYNLGGPLSAYGGGTTADGVGYLKNKRDWKARMRAKEQLGGAKAAFGKVGAGLAGAVSGIADVGIFGGFGDMVSGALDMTKLARNDAFKGAYSAGSAAGNIGGIAVDAMTGQYHNIANQALDLGSDVAGMTSAFTKDQDRYEKSLKGEKSLDHLSTLASLAGGIGSGIKANSAGVKAAELGANNARAAEFGASKVGSFLSKHGSTLDNIGKFGQAATTSTKAIKGIKDAGMGTVSDGVSDEVTASITPTPDEGLLGWGQGAGSYGDLGASGSGFGIMENGGPMMGSIGSTELQRFNGATHENGGIQHKGVEVEGGETQMEDYIFSDNIGYDKKGNPTPFAKKATRTFAAESKKLDDHFSEQAQDFITNNSKEFKKHKLKSDNESVREMANMLEGIQNPMAMNGYPMAMNGYFENTAARLDRLSGYEGMQGSTDYSTPDMAPTGKKDKGFEFTSGDKLQMMSMIPSAGFNMKKIFEGYDKETPEFNPYEFGVKQLMADRKVSLQPAINEMNLSTTAGRKALDSTSAGVRNANLQQLYANSAQKRGMLKLQEQQMNAGFRGEEASMLGNLGAARVAAKNYASDITAKNKATHSNFGAALATDLGQGFANLGQFKNTQSMNRLKIASANSLSTRYKLDIDNVTKMIKGGATEADIATYAEMVKFLGD